jgi:anti-anti-sigma factor
VATAKRRPRRRPSRNGNGNGNNGNGNVNGNRVSAAGPAAELPLDECGLLIEAEDRDRLRLLRLSGVMDLSMLGAQETQLQEAIGQPPALPVVIDLSGVLFCDCDGLGALVRAAYRHPAGTTAIALANPQPVVARLLSVMPPDPLTVYPTLDAALGSIG